LNPGWVTIRSATVKQVGDMIAASAARMLVVTEKWMYWRYAPSS
jgi:hypothetical protein